MCLQRVWYEQFNLNNNDDDNKNLNNKNGNNNYVNTTLNSDGDLPCFRLLLPAVVVGFDRMINYYKIQYAQLCINENSGCEFIATNLDAVTHLTDAQVQNHVLF